MTVFSMTRRTADSAKIQVTGGARALGLCLILIPVIVPGSIPDPGSHCRRMIL